MRNVVYIAGPFFNPQQIAIVERIAHFCNMHDLPHYMPKTDSGSADFTPEDRKNPAKWQEVFDSNRKALHEVDLVVATVEYAMPESTVLGVMSGYTAIPIEPNEDLKAVTDFKPIELPDSGTVWEMGYAKAIGTPVLGFHSVKPPEQLNLMLSHGCDGIVSGWEALDKFLSSFRTFTVERSVAGWADGPEVAMARERLELKKSFWKWDTNQFEGDVE